jgi:NAD(P)-dependent dehydrogenase (short-subunit alcohol dehydrogenase family)
MRKAVVTGSTKGIGFALARELVRRGHSVVITGRTQAAVNEAAERLRKEAADGVTVHGRAVDVTDAAQVEELWNAAVDALGGVDLWINNAGVAHTTRPIVETPADEVRVMVTTNMLGTVYGAQVAVRGMRANGGGQVFNILGGGSDGRIRPGMASTRPPSGALIPSPRLWSRRPPGRECGSARSAPACSSPRDGSGRPPPHRNRWRSSARS